MDRKPTARKRGGVGCGGVGEKRIKPPKARDLTTKNNGLIGAIILSTVIALSLIVFLDMRT